MHINTQSQYDSDLQFSNANQNPRMSPYARGTWNAEAVRDSINHGFGKLTTGGLFAGGLYAGVQRMGGNHGVTALGIAGGVYGVHTAASWHRGRVANAAAQSAYDMHKQAGMAEGPATKLAEEAYKGASAAHPYSRFTSAVKNTSLYLPKMAGRGAVEAAKGLVSPAAIGAYGTGAGFIAGSAINAAKDLEHGARLLLTGSPMNGLRGRGFLASKPFDSWMPGFNSLPKKDFRRYSLNPKIASRASWAVAAMAVGSAINSVIQPGAPGATTYFDGRQMRHINDMGANAQYAQKILGRNAAPGFNRDTMGTTGAMLADDALLAGSRMFI